MKNVYKLIFHLLNSIFILSNFSQTISLYSLGGPSASRFCVFAYISCTPGSLAFKHPGHTVLDGSLENKFSKFCIIESYLWELRFWPPLKLKLRMSHLMLNIRFGKSGHGKASAFTVTDVMLSLFLLLHMCRVQAHHSSMCDRMSHWAFYLQDRHQCHISLHSYPAYCPPMHIQWQSQTMGPNRASIPASHTWKVKWHFFGKGPHHQL